MMSLFDTVKASVTTRQAAEYYGLKINHYGMCVCPFHKDKNPSMKVDKRFHCFACNEDGDVIDFASKYFGLNLMDAAYKLCQDFNISYEKSKRSVAKSIKPKKSDEALFKDICRYSYKVLSDYLHLLKKWKIEYAPKDETSEWHPYFCEALNEINHIEYLLDTLLEGNVSDRAFLIKDNERRVKNIERRIKDITL